MENNTFYNNANETNKKIFIDYLKNFEINFEYKSNIFEINNFYCHVNFFTNKEINTNKPIMILVHGYGTNSSDFFKLVPLLLKDYNLIWPDVIGMGLSCEKINKQNKKQIFYNINNCWEFFLSYFDKLIENLSLKNYIIVAHSLGAYLISHYLSKYENTVIKFYSLSPGGFNKAKEKEELENARTMLDNLIPYFFKTIAKYTYRKIFESKKSPYDWLFWPIRRIFLSKLYKKKSWNLKNHESIWLEELFDQIYTQKPEGYQCLGYIFHYSMRSLLPITDILNNINLPMYVLCGDNDWIDKEEIEKNLGNENLDKNFKYSLINNSSHELLFDNEKEIYEYITNN